MTQNKTIIESPQDVVLRMIGKSRISANYFTPRGVAKSPMMLVGYRPNDAKVEPFDGESHRVLRDFCEEWGVDLGRIVYTTYLVKTHKLNSYQMVTWRAILDAEIEAVQPRAVVLMGALLAKNYFLAFQNSLDFYRGIRWNFPKFPNTTFFVVPSPEEVLTGPSSLKGVFTTDLEAISFSRHERFPTEQTVSWRK